MHRRSLSIVLGVVAALAAATVPALAASPPPGAHAHVAATPVSLDSPAAKLRIDLDRLLAEHAFLTIEQMRSGLVGSPDFAAAAKAVEGNSTDIASAIGSVYGQDAVAPFADIWRAHIGYLVDYAVALGKGDDAGRQRALSGLATYREDLKAFLAKANPGIDISGIGEALDMHTAQLVEFIDAEHAGDHGKAYAIERKAYPHMFEIGDALTKVIANRSPQSFTGLDVAYSAAGSLRVTLDRILAEHAFIAAEAMRAGVADEASFPAAAQAIDGNSYDLQGVVSAAYGDRAATAFRELWDGHIKAYVAFIEAERAGDATGAAAAKQGIEQAAAKIAGFLAGANPNLDANALATLFQEHSQHLTGQVESFASKDYDRTYELVREGYAHMFTAGESLAAGVATQMPQLFPADAPAPATDTLNHSDPAPFTAVAIWAAIALLAAGFGVVLAILTVRTRRVRRD